MSMPSPFELGAAIGGNVSGGIQRGAEMSAIDQILQKASASGNPEDIQNVMGQLLQRVSPDRQQVASQILGNKLQELQAKRTKAAQDQAYAAQGLDPNLPESINKEIVKTKAKGKEGYESALSTIKRQRELLKSGHLGPKIGFTEKGRDFGSTFSSEGQRSRAEYEQLGKSLIQMASTIPIRNRSEFEVLAHKLYDPEMGQNEIAGTLDAMEKIIRDNLGESAQQAPKNADFVQIKAPDGTIRNIPRDRAEAAQKAGGTLVQ